MTKATQTHVTAKNITQQSKKEQNTSNTTTSTEPTRGIRSARPHMYHSVMTRVGNGATGAAGDGRAKPDHPGSERSASQTNEFAGQALVEIRSHFEYARQTQRAEKQQLSSSCLAIWHTLKDRLKNN